MLFYNELLTEELIKNNIMKDLPCQSDQAEYIDNMSHNDGPSGGHSHVHCDQVGHSCNTLHQDNNVNCDLDIHTICTQ